jgi:hypothetical protein
VLGLPVATQGRLNAYKSLQFGLAAPVLTTVLTPQGSTSVSRGTSFSVELSVTNHDTVAHNTHIVLYVRAPNGRNTVINAINVNLSPGQTSTNLHTIPVPASTPVGTKFTLFGQAETNNSFDESGVEYTVVP